MIAMRYLLTVPVLIASLGCSSTPGSPFGFSTPQHHLLPEAKSFRQMGGTPAAPRELAKTLLPTYVIEPGDVLLVQPVDVESPIRLPVDQPVLMDGTIDLGRFGRPVVAGKTLAEIEPQVR